MSQDQRAIGEVAERQELHNVVNSLARSPRLAKLLGYLAEKYFAGELEGVNEYAIATDVFDRSKTSFDPGQDAIARVETHRLRKKLAEYYDSDGLDHPIQIVVPAGSYAPVFTRRSSQPSTAKLADEKTIPPEDHSSAVPLEKAGPEQGGTADTPGMAKTGAFGSLKVRWSYRGIALEAAVFVIAASLYVVGRSHRTWTLAGTTPSLAAGSTPTSSTVVVPGAISAPVRILCGYDGKPQIDSSGAIWGTDAFYHGGGTMERPPHYLARTGNTLPFGHWRGGEFSYDIPLKPGIYELHLFFSTPDRADESTSTFTVRLNNQEILSDFDVNSDAMGEDIADERVFRDVSPGSDGYLHLSFRSGRGPAALNAIEILPGLSHRQLPIRIITQPESFTDRDGNLWSPDNYYMGGREAVQQREVLGSPAADRFETERYGHFSYAIPVDTRDRYTVVLHFAEFYFGREASGVGGVGSRVFRVLCNGSVLLDDFDIYKEAGSLRTLTKSFTNIKPTAQGKINLTFEPVLNYATVSAIEVIDESK